MSLIDAIFLKQMRSFWNFIERLEISVNFIRSNEESQETFHSLG